VPAGENPPPGALIDYYLAVNASGPVTLDILDASGKTVRTYSSDNRLAAADPATDPDRYNTLCQQTPSLPDCGLPLYWPAPQMSISTQAGMHRFNWDMRFDPVSDAGGGRGGSMGAVPHRTYSAVNAPWAPPGNYTVRLTVDGKKYTQPITVRLDPRVKTSAAALTQLATLSREMYDGAVAAHAAYLQARGVATQLNSATGDDLASFKASLDSLAPPPPAGGRGRGGFGGGGGGRGGAQPAGPPTLESASNAMLAAAMAMQGADVAPTATQVANAAKARAQEAAVMARWNRLRTSELATLNAKRKAAGEAPIVIP
jgi:hypothetical protein